MGELRRACGRMTSENYNIITGDIEGDNKENIVLDKMPKIFNSTAKDRTDFSRPVSANTNQRFSRPTSSQMFSRQSGVKSRGLASRPTTANNSKSTDVSFSGGRLVERNGEKFVLTNKQKVSGYKKFPSQGVSSWLTTQTASYEDHSKSLRGHKKLEPYRPDSARSRLPVRFKGEPKPFTRHCAARNMSQFCIGVQDHEWEKWKNKAVKPMKRQRPASAMN